MKLIEKYEFKIFSHILKKYDVEFYHKDRMGILAKRNFKDNFAYIFSTKNSCDAVPMMIALDKKIKKSKIGIDIGANIGITTMWMARHCEKVYSFEPDLDNIKRFNENIEVNNISNVELVQQAVSNENGVATFHLFDSYGHHSLDQNHIAKAKKSVQVKTITLDQFCEEKGIQEIDVLKIDVEGLEYDVLQGSCKKLQSNAIKMIIFEHSPILLDKQGKSKSEVIDYLTKNRYKTYKLDATEVMHDDINNLGQEDLYAICE
jgi:FkbM family methyltransferase